MKKLNLTIRLVIVLALAAALFNVYTDVRTFVRTFMVQDVEAKFEIWHGQEAPETDYPSAISVSDIQQVSAQKDFELTYLIPILLLVTLIAGHAFERAKGYKNATRGFISILLIFALSNVMFFAPHSFTGYEVPDAEAAVAVQDRNNSEETAGTLTHTVSLPASISAGDLLIVQIVINDGSTGLTSLTATGYTEIVSTALTLEIAEFWFYRNADGTEGATVDFTSDNSETSVHRTWRITGHDSGTAPEGAGTQSAANDANPPSLTPSWGAEENLWLVGMGIWGARTISAAPTNYSNLFADNTGADSGSNVTLGAAERVLNASSEDPDAFTHDAPAARDTTAVTVAVKPAVAADASSVKIRGGTTIRGGTIFR